MNSRNRCVHTTVHDLYDGSTLFRHAACYIDNEKRERRNNCSHPDTQILQFYDVRVGETERNGYTRVSGGVYFIMPSNANNLVAPHTQHTTTHNSLNRLINA
jgi:hypothetical protein